MGAGLSRDGSHRERSGSAFGDEALGGKSQRGLEIASVPCFEAYAGTAPENYERYFVPAIGRPLADALADLARIRPGQRVLDLACGTGIVARVAAERVGADGSVAGVDINPGMLAVARSTPASGAPISWHEAAADALPFPDGAFDLVLCQLGFQFFPDRLGALREMRRVLAPSGRTLVLVPGPAPEIFVILEQALAAHVTPDVAAFVQVVFSLHEPGELRGLLAGAGFRRFDARADSRTLQLPPPGSSSGSTWLRRRWRPRPRSSTTTPAPQSRGTLSPHGNRSHGKTG